jgi:hypothetical protein
MISFVAQEKRAKNWIPRLVILEKLKFAFVLTVALFYTLIFTTIISPFNCVSQGNNAFSLTYNATISCYDSDWMNYRLPVLIIFIILYVVLFPYLLIREYLIFRRRSDVKMERLSPLFIFLTRSYRPSLYWWELVHLLKRLAIILFGTFDIRVGTEKYFSILIVLLIFFMIDLTFFPYERKSLMQISMIWNCSAFLTLMIDGLVFRSATSTPSQRTLCVALIIIMISLSFILSLRHIYRSRFLKIRKKVFPSHLDPSDGSSEIIAKFSPDAEFLSSYKSGRIAQTESSIRIQWKEIHSITEVETIQVEPIALDKTASSFTGIQIARNSTTT